MWRRSRRGVARSQIQEGTEKDRVVSVEDPEMRHGHKSASQRFNGHKAAVAVDLESQLISGVEVLAGNAGDQEKALELVHQSERVMEAEVVETVGDCAYGGGPTRRTFADEERVLTAKVPASTNGDCFPSVNLSSTWRSRKCAARRGRRRTTIGQREKGGVAASCLRRLPVRPAPCARNAWGEKGRVPLPSRRKKVCSSKRASITKPRREARACASGWWWSIGSRD